MLDSLRRIPNLPTQNSSSERGATFVEFSLVFLLVFMLVVVIIDTARYALALNSASFAARQILDKAKTDSSIITYVRNASGTPEATRFVESRDRVLAQGLGAARLDPNGQGYGSSGKLAEFELSHPGDLSQVVKRHALLLKPGDSAVRTTSFGRDLVFHPTCINCSEFRNPSKNGYELLQSKHGMYSQVVVELPLLITGWSPVLVVGEAISWEEAATKRDTPEFLETAEPAISCKKINKAAACEEAGCDANFETCSFNPNLYSPDCARCVPKRCQAYWDSQQQETGQDFCQTIGCTVPGQCRFSPDRQLTEMESPEECGDCLGNQLCKHITTAEEACNQKNCAVSHRCEFRPNTKQTDPDGCAICRPLACYLWTTEQEACAQLDCNDQGNSSGGGNNGNSGNSSGSTCYFKSTFLGTPCAECRPNTCQRPQGGCPSGKVWSSQPQCRCCDWRDCSVLNDPQTGEEIESFRDETYKINPMLGEESTDLWVNEVWEGTKIGKEVYINMRPRQIQYLRLSNPSICHAGIIGQIYNTNQSKPTSMLDRMKPYQYLYDAVKDRLNKTIAKNYGKILELDKARMPSGWDYQKWLYFIEQDNISVVDSFKEGNKGAATGKIAGNFNTSGRRLDLEVGNSIQMYISLLEYLKEEMYEISGVTKQRQGQVDNRETVGGVERAVSGSSHVTEETYSIHDNVRKRCLTALLETAKIALKGRSKKAQYLTDDKIMTVF